MGSPSHNGSFLRSICALLEYSASTEPQDAIDEARALRMMARPERTATASMSVPAAPALVPGFLHSGGQAPESIPSTSLKDARVCYLVM